ncbi:hypothetical protein [Piscirickettsia salmonis]|uniref:hypothetical protein n=1 Tax=Piscirickettsia salmonis TaxID=1238 RepID=UPI0012D32CFA|nr:hypothetical protein [Piscirickettsia salmonis]
MQVNNLSETYSDFLQQSRPNGLSQLRSAKNPNLPRPTHPVLSTPWLAALD